MELSFGTDTSKGAAGRASARPKHERDWPFASNRGLPRADASAVHKYNLPVPSTRGHSRDDQSDRAVSWGPSAVGTTEIDEHLRSRGDAYGTRADR